MTAGIARMTPLDRARAWYTEHTAIMEGRREGPNEFALYVPVEARAETEAAARRGQVPVFTEAHFRLWAALTEVLGVEEFSAPLGLDEEDVRKSILGMDAAPGGEGRGR
ncbi:MAG: hypothetical protein ACNS63_08080 [Candidatus Nitrospinota bacterium M3_3B_026]